MPDPEMHKKNLAEIKRTFFTVDENFRELWKKAAGDKNKEDELTSLRDGARDTFWAADAKRLEDNHKAVQDTRESLKAANDDLDREIESMQSFSRILSVLSQAVRLAAALASLAAV